jgi:trehalose-6-phosphate synthase
MPIEIKELTIKVNVNQEKTNTTANAGSNALGKENEDKESLMKEAAEQVLRILENKKER